MRKYLIFLLLCLMATFPAAPVAAEQVALPSPNEVITLINQYRQQNGIPTLEYNALLASLAQGQSDYQATISTITHTGPGGTTPQQRAEAAGYGDGSWFYLSEIIYGGTTATPSSALAWWKNSGLHNSIMLDPKYTEIGAGVATDGEMTYFTAELGGATGATTVNPTTPPSSSGTDPAPTSEPVPVIIPVMKSTPNPDGSVHHIVQEGQSLWTIAAIYDTTPEKLIELNGMDSSYIFPGDDLLISLDSDQSAATQTPTSGPDATPTSESISKALPSVTPTSDEVTKMLGTPFSMQVEQPTETPEPTVLTSPTPLNISHNDKGGFLNNNPIVSTLVIAAVVILVVVILASGFMQTKPGRPSRDDPVK